MTTGIQILHRHAEASEQPFSLVSTTETLEGARDELASWSGPYLSHGDLVRVVSKKRETLYVFDGDRGELREVGVPRGRAPWLAFWEGPEADAYEMLLASAGVDRRRVVLAACACARTALQYVPAGEDRPRIAIETAERWARGEATFGEVRAAARATAAAAEAAAAAAYANAATAAWAAADAAYSAYADAAPWAAAAAAYANAARATANDAALRAMAPLVRRYVPLSVLACARVGAADPLPVPRDNPRRRR